MIIKGMWVPKVWSKLNFEDVVWNMTSEFLIAISHCWRAPCHGNDMKTGARGRSREFPLLTSRSQCFILWHKNYYYSMRIKGIVHCKRCNWISFHFWTASLRSSNQRWIFNSFCSTSNFRKKIKIDFTFSCCERTSSD